MRRKYESGREPPQLRYAWIVALACIVVTGFLPTAAMAQPVPGETAVDDADEAAEANAFTPASTAADDTAAVDDEVTQEELDEAEVAIEEAERQLDEAKRQMELMGRKMAPEPTPVPGTGPGLVTVDDQAKKLQVSLNEDGTLYLRFAMWLQVWTRAIQLNPGTEVLGNDNAWYGDVGLRRARFLMFGKIFPRTFLLMHIGINNQIFKRTLNRQPVLDANGDPTGDTVVESVGVTRKPQLYFHDAWVEFEAEKKGHLSLGAGLLYWNGISRMTNASTITAMSLDLPISNWPLIETTDQFARQFGIYAKGKAGLFDYRVAVVRPFTPSTTAFTATGAPNTAAGLNVTANTFGYSGYFQFQFLDIESNTLPYTVGTYIGAKKVFNFGFGGHGQPKGVAYTGAAGDFRTRWLYILGADLFLDMPFKGEDKGAATWYGVYWRQDFGPNALRSIGIMNPGDGGTGNPFNGRGNGYPMIGTGHTGYTELGFLLPGKVGATGTQFQIYLNSQLSKFEALNDGMIHLGAGLNIFVHRHNAKVTLEYRNRPIFDAGGNVTNRKGNSLVLQMHLFI